MMKPHRLHIYQKPKRGNAFIRSEFALNYTHKISASGGFDTASCDVYPRTFGEGQKFLQDYIGNRVAVYVDNPMEPIWEGYINRMTFNYGGLAYTISLDEMYNAVIVNYSTSVNARAQTGGGSDLTSQNMFGFKQGAVEGAFEWGGIGTQADALQDSLIVSRAWPQTSITPGGDTGLITIEMNGFYHTLEWQFSFSSSTAAITYSAYVQTVLGLFNNTAFFDKTDFSAITTVAAQRAAGDAPGRTLWDMLNSLAMSGSNNGDIYVVGVTPTDPRTKTRRLYYQPANLTVEYTTRVSDGLRIRNQYGRLIEPWLVRPDRGIRIVDVLQGWSMPGDDPRETYIQSIEYIAEQGKVLYYGADDTSIEGVFNFKNGRADWYKKRLGSRIRTS